MDINLELYRVFYHVASEKSFSKAAEKLFVTQPAVSQSIAQLESKINQKLFIRNNKGMVLTEAGEILLSHIEPAFYLFQTALNQIDALNDLQRGNISISASDTICMYYLPDILQRFKSMYPHITLKIANRTTAETIEALKRGKADIGLIHIPENMDDKIKVWKTETLHECFVAGKEYRKTIGDVLDVKDLPRHPLMLLEKTTSSRSFIDSVLANHQVTVNAEIELGSVDLLLKFASINMGISCVTKEYMEKSAYKHKLEIIPLSIPIPQRYLGVVTVQNIPPTRAGRAFMDQIMEKKD